ncbi:MAG: Gfo/Idh/MocA family oxidoreductase [Mycobacteriaceae bacterium]|nr:Gfo/Idh/MocA family oxidoreductase [Mycobacteriaceae bacterium]
MAPDLRVAVLGAGVMGTDHVERITRRVSGARVVVVNDYLPEKAEQVAAGVPGARVVGDPLDAIGAEDVDAVLLATPGPVHEKQLLTCLEHGKPVLCEKPLTTDAETALAIVRRETALDARLIQVGFMRRFDPEYVALKALLDGGELGEPLVMHCVHRNPAVPPNFDSAMVVRDSLVHEVDVTRFLFAEEITAVRVIRPRRNSNAPDGLQDPQIAIFQTAGGRHVDVEVFLSTGVAYEVRTEVVGELGSASIGLDVGLVRRSPSGMWGGRITPGFRERFARAYDIEVQRWVDAVRAGINVAGPSAWDGYAAVAVCEAAVRALESGELVDVELAER